MLLKYFYYDKVAHASYLVGCQRTGEAIVIDPGRDVGLYLNEAQANGMQIVGAAETHIHADFVSGARQLAAQVGAKLYLSDEGGEGWQYQYTAAYDCQLLKDGDSFRVGNIKFEALHSPGHTPEHLSFILTDTAGANQPMGMFSGDFVFVGSTGRPDLLEEAAGLTGTADRGARDMYRSVNRFKTLPDYLQLWPGHGAGSACGKGLGAVPSSTIGYEKLFNPMLNLEDEQLFVDSLLADQPEPPAYFAMMKTLNKVGPAVLDGKPQPPQLAVQQMAQLLDAGAVVVDLRTTAEFAAQHLPGTINIPLNNGFTTWAGWFLGYDSPFYLIADEDQLDEAVTDLIYIGLDNIGGYAPTRVISDLNGDESYESTTPEAIAAQVAKGEVTLIDVRNLSEWNEGRIEQAHGVKQVLNLAGGYTAWNRANLPIYTNGA